MSIPNYTDVDLGPVLLRYTFTPGQDLPDVGTLMDTEDCHMLVTESNVEKGYITVLVTPKQTLSHMANQQAELLVENIDIIAEMIYNKTSQGMTSLIGWDNLPTEEQIVYTTLTKDIITHLSENKLLSVQYISTDD